MNDQLKKAIENEFVRKAPKGFSDRVMDKIFEIKGQLVVKPLISKWGWLTIVIVGVAFIAFLFRLPVQQNEPEINVIFSFFDNLSKQADKITFQMPEFFPNTNIMLIILGVALALFLLVSFDRFLFSRKE